MLAIAPRACVRAGPPPNPSVPSPQVNPSPVTAAIPPGLVVLHGNRLELLHDLVVECQARWPLQPLEEEVVVVQSNGAAEWFKARQAEDTGICGACRVELPARFLWRLYRRALGRGALAERSALDRDPLAWRLYAMLPELAAAPGCEPLVSWLGAAEPRRRLQLAARLADLYDQYQVWRPDWLELWARGIEVVTDAAGVRRGLDPDARWQALVWRALCEDLGPEQRAAVRPEVHARVLARLRAGDAAALPRRVIVFGASTIPPAVLEVLVELSRHAQVVIAVPNPCRFHWADAVDGRELLRAARRRQPDRGGVDLAALPLDAMHVHAHPLLAAWGRQGRDFMRQLDAHDTGASAGLPRIDAFDLDEGGPLLRQVQAAIRDLLPQAEHPRLEVAPDDRSITFTVAHGPQREVEILHDQLLDLFAESGDAALRPRDVVVMVPDVTAWAAAIDAVFGQYGRGDARFIPYDIADLGSRGRDPLALALEWLLGIDAHRIGAGELLDLLDVPAVAARLGVDAADRPLLARWVRGAGVRWGLDPAQRAGLGLPECGDAASWSAGLDRMLLGYASDRPWDGVEPFDEVGGLDAGVVGVVGTMVESLRAWWRTARTPARPAQWAARGEALLRAWFAPQDEAGREALARAQDALADWLDACACAGFDDAVDLEVFRDAWLRGLDEPPGGGRFLAGGVTFCSLMPLRAIPFEVVCLLGMNDGDYPRPARRDDLDLMARPGLHRPGDRARRDDDRYLMLEALLAARRRLSISWSGRSPRDDSAQPPSVLVAQLRDYLAACWRGAGGGELLAQLTTVHPLQAFSRRYFGDGALHTHAREWRRAHLGAERGAIALTPFEPGAGALGLRALASFVAAPVRAFFRDRLDVVFDPVDDALDEEVFDLGGLDRHRALAELIADPDPAEDPEARVATRLRSLRAASELPLGAPGERAAAHLGAEAAAMLGAWRALALRHPRAQARLRLRLEHDGITLDDWIDGLREGGVRLGLVASRLLDGRAADPRRLVDPWVRMLAAAAAGAAVRGWLVGRDAVLELAPPPEDAARRQLGELIGAWRRGMDAPLPLALGAGLAQVRGGDPRRAYESAGPGLPREADEPCLARLFPDFASLSADGRFALEAERLYAPLADWVAAHVRVHDHADMGAHDRGAHDRGAGAAAGAPEGPDCAGSRDG